jgi:hypothetical protein
LLYFVQIWVFWVIAYRDRKLCVVCTFSCAASCNIQLLYVI